MAVRGWKYPDQAESEGIEMSKDHAVKCEMHRKRSRLSAIVRREKGSPVAGDVELGGGVGVSGSAPVWTRPLLLMCNALRLQESIVSEKSMA